MRTGEEADLGDLLNPTLSAVEPSAPLLSLRASYLVSFFGGPPGALAVAILNARTLGRLKEDLWALALLGGAYLGLVSLLTLHAAEPELEVSLFGVILSARELRFLMQALGLAFFTVFYSRHRQHHRAREMMGVAPRPAWIIGIALVVAGGAVHSCILMLLLRSSP